MAIAFVNLQHSGTGFVLEKLLRGDYLGMETEEARAARFAFTHVSRWNIGWLYEELPHYEGVFTVTRLGIEESWAKRGQALEELRVAQELLPGLMRRFDGVTLDLDSPARDRQLAQLNQRFGLQLQTDWQRVPSLKDSHLWAR